MPFPPINLHSRISSPGKDLFRKKKSGPSVLPPEDMLNPKARDQKDAESDALASSWPSGNLKHMARRSAPHAARFQPNSATVDLDAVQSSWLSGSCESVPRSSSGESAARRGLGKDEIEQEVQFSLSLTPEAILVIQKRNLEKQMLAKQQKCCGSAEVRHRRAAPSKRTQGAAKPLAPGAKPEPSNDISAIVKISLLNDQHKYDDVEYEEEEADVDETVMRKCKEWLKGVESAAAFSRVDKLAALPHLQSC